ncbi:hypothetical protein A4A49_60857, partial [Nicotiana attenuata]
SKITIIQLLEYYHKTWNRMEKATFVKIFLVSFLLILFGQSSNAAFSCSKDADCPIKCIDADVKCDLTTHLCHCRPKHPPTTNSKGAKRVHKTIRD